MFGIILLWLKFFKTYYCYFLVFGCHSSTVSLLMPFLRITEIFFTLMPIFIHIIQKVYIPRPYFIDKLSFMSKQIKDVFKHLCLSKLCMIIQVTILKINCFR